MMSRPPLRLRRILDAHVLNVAQNKHLAIFLRELGVSFVGADAVVLDAQVFAQDALWGEDWI